MIEFNGSRQKFYFHFLPILTVLVSISFLGFQNCSEVKLVKPPIVQALVDPTVDLKAKICSQIRFEPGQAAKFVFVVDLSASNFGDWVKEPVGSNLVYYWDTTLATDPQANRFEAIKYFINNCGSQEGNKFSVIGFSGAAGTINGNRLTCEVINFTTGSQAIQNINTLQSRQAVDQAWYQQWLKPRYLTEKQPDSLIYSVTSYQSAMTCLQKLIVDDLAINTADQTNLYRVFFISDGVPQDKRGEGCNLSSLGTKEQLSCYLESILDPITMIRTAAISKGKDLRLQGLFYGLDTTTPTVLEELSKEGGTSGVVPLQSIANNREALCDFLNNQNGIEYRPDFFSAVNLTTLSRKGVVMADSDIDGIPDLEEVALGFDPAISRSRVPGILDGVCLRLGGIPACETRRAEVTCDEAKFDKFGLSECDFKILGLDAQIGLSDWGVDADKDGIPDFVEVVKGTDPARADMTGDPDADGVTTRNEVFQGTDPFFPDSDFPTREMNQFQTSYSSYVTNACPNGSWSLFITQLQSLKNLNFQSAPATLNYLNHASEEQIVLLFYRLNPINSLKVEAEYFSQSFRAKVDRVVDSKGVIQSIRIFGDPVQLQPSDFNFVGKVIP